MVGLTRFFYLMNLCEKTPASTSVYRHFYRLQKDVDFLRAKKLFVLQTLPPFFRQRPGATSF